MSSVLREAAPPVPALLLSFYEPLRAGLGAASLSAELH